MKLTFVFLLVVLLAFIWVPGLPLQETVATHFDGAGKGNGFMSRSGYHWYMTGFVLFMSLAMVWFPSWLNSRSSKWISLPNREYWMAPERRDASAAYLERWLLRLGILTLALIGYVHWLVVKANQSTPTMLATDHLLIGMFAYLLAMTGLVVQLFLRFRSENRSGR